MKVILLTLTLLFTTHLSYSQTFKGHNFKVVEVCNLENVLNTGEGSVYQCIDQSSAITIYRVIFRGFKEQITDTETYFNDLKRLSSKTGAATFTTVKGKKGVQVNENVTVEGHNLKQLSVFFLHKNKSIQIVLVTNSSASLVLFEKFKTNVYFL